MSLPNTDSSRWSFSDNQDLSLQCVHACGADGQLNECRMASCGESIYNLIPSEQAVPPRLPRHKSCFPGKLDEKTLVYPMGVAKQPNSKRTFGKPDGMVAPHPQSFTKAHGGHATLPDPQKPERTRDIRKGRTPKRAEKPTMNLHSGKNFITTNAVEAILSHPPKQELEKPYTMKKNFGKVPQYLESNKKMIALEKQQVAEFLKAQHAETEENKVAKLDPEERAQLIRHLKLKWSSVNTAYQKIPLTLDTLLKKKRKELNEQQLAEIEKDIKLLEQGEVILVMEG